MEEPTVLRTTKIGNGFVKEDVMQYLDELNEKIVNLEDELKKTKDAGPADPQEVIKYRNQVDKLQEKFNKSNKALRDAKTELEELKKKYEQDEAVISQLKAQGGGGGIDPSELVAAKAEIEKLKGEVKASEQKVLAAQKAVANAQKAASSTDSAEKDAQIAKISGELSLRDNELKTKNAQLSEKDARISELSKELQAKTSAVAERDAQIERLNGEVSELKDKAEAGGMIPPSLDMGALFTEAQKTANKITIEARNAADKTTKEASENAEKIVREATVKAQETLNGANATAEACINEANEQAKVTVNEANAHADKVNELSATVRRMLLNEIEGVNAKFKDISLAITRLTSQAGDRMSEAQSIIDAARKSIDENKNADVKKVDAPSATFEARKLSSVTGESGSGVNNTGANRMSGSSSSASQYNSQPRSYSSSSAGHTEQKPKKAANFSFDMSELLKAAEEEAAKSPDSNQ